MLIPHSKFSFAVARCCAACVSRCLTSSGCFQTFLCNIPMPGTSALTKEMMIWPFRSLPLRLALLTMHAGSRCIDPWARLVCCFVILHFCFGFDGVECGDLWLWCAVWHCLVGSWPHLPQDGTAILIPLQAAVSSGSELSLIGPSCYSTQLLSKHKEHYLAAASIAGSTSRKGLLCAIRDLRQ